jgi:hypothetical protein
MPDRAFGKLLRVAQKLAGGGPRRLGQPSSSPYGANRNVVTALGKPKARLRSANPMAPLPEAERMAASKFGSFAT